MNKIWMAVTAGLLFAAGYISTGVVDGQGQKETPVTVGDGGSILIEVPADGRKLNEFAEVDAASISHPDAGEMGCVVVMRGAQVIKRDKCKKGRPCVVTFLSAADPTFGDVSVTVRASFGGKMAIRSNVPFAQWDKSNPAVWKLPIPGKLTSVDLRDDDGASQRNLCRNGGCKVKISFPSSFDSSKACQ